MDKISFLSSIERNGCNAVLFAAPDTPAPIIDHDLAAAGARLVEAMRAARECGR